MPVIMFHSERNVITGIFFCHVIMGIITHIYQMKGENIRA